LKTYDSNVGKVMEFLHREGYSPSLCSQHGRFYRDFRTFLRENNLGYSDSTVEDWLRIVQKSKNRRQYAGARHCMAQLRDISSEAFISPAHLGFRASAYSLLMPQAKTEVDEFLASDAKHQRNNLCRLACARFMLYLQKCDIPSVQQLNYAALLAFHEEDYHRSYKAKDVYEDHIRAFLKYHAGLGRCSLGLSIALNKMLIPKIVHVERNDFEQESGEFITWRGIELFLEKMRSSGYGETVLASTKHILSVLYVFLDMHALRLNATVLWRWFDLVKPRLATNFRQARRSLCQYLDFLKTGDVTTAMTGNPHKVGRLALLPTWCQEELSSYLALQKREGWRPSTLAMQRSSNLRFCDFLVNAGVQSFSDLTPQLLHEFYLQDPHKTPEGKAAYNSRIRSFIAFLSDRGVIANPLLARALPSTFAPHTKIIEALTGEEVRKIWSVDTSSLSPIALRDYAMVCIGLGMGFRASDIVALRYEDIDWKKHCINLIQQKTGKGISLPMPAKVGNILFQYLTRGRPKSSCANVFIRHKAPFNPIRKEACAAALNRFLSERGKKKGGFHIVRKTFASGLLQGNVRVERISDALGHTTDETVGKYLSLDEERMHQCPISLAEAGIRHEWGDLNA
ncbi:MAG: tyrosine-type recombinase/integrase, partial [Bacillota bacterium]|nr:tyrosine-type recombinase/integrase [Bacillota bacterium]